MTVDVGPTGDFVERQLRLVRTRGREIGVVRWSGELFAVQNYCTHQGGPLCGGILSGRLESDKPGSLRLDSTSPVLACPWHGWEFDLRTGRALPDPKARVRTYPVREVDGRVLIDVDASSPSAELGSGAHHTTQGAA